MKDFNNHTDSNRCRFFDVGGSKQAYGNDCYGNCPELRICSARTIKNENSEITYKGRLNSFIMYLMFVR